MTPTTTGFTDPRSGPAALYVDGLGRRYRRGWALQNCSFRIPAGTVCALVGPNGAGKSTLLSLAADLLAPSSGTIRVFGKAPGSRAARRSTALLSQDKPLYRGLKVGEILRMGREMNPGWDQAVAERVVAKGSIPLDARTGSLSGGQRTRVALALALGKRPRLLLLDEPMADLDPLVRHEMTTTLLTEAAENGTTVVLSSHMVSELEGACDFVVVVGAGSVRLAGGIEELLAAHRIVTDPAGSPGSMPYGCHAVGAVPGMSATVLRVDDHGTAHGSRPTLEQLLMTYLAAPATTALVTDAARAGRNEVPA